MKLKLIICLCFIGIIAQGQVVTFKFDYPGAGAPSCNSFNELWSGLQSSGYTCKVSHGSPTFGKGSSSLYQYLVLRGSNSTGLSESEGVYINYKFKKGFKYDITVSYQKNDQKTVGFGVYGAVGLIATNNSNCKESELPYVAYIKELFYNPAVYSTNVGYLENIEISTWVPNQEMDALWLRSDQVYYDNSATILIREVIINCLGSVDTESPSKPANLVVNQITANNCNISWNASTDDTGVAGYEVYLNGVKKNSTTKTTFSVSGLNSCTKYTVLVKAFDAYGNKSEAANVVFNTISDIEKEMIINTDLTGQPVYLKASKAIYLKSGFRYVAINTQYGRLFSASIVPDGCSAINTPRLSPNQDQPFNDNLESKLSYKITKSKLPFEEMNSRLELFPNPVNSVLNITFDNDCYSVKLLNNMGTIVKTIKNCSGNTTIDLNDFSSGAYFVIIDTEDGYTESRIIIKK